MKNTLLILITFFSFITKAKSQSLGNEWINYNQTYFKFKIHQNGIYRISASQLFTAGMALGTSGSALQLFRDGAEVRLLVSNNGTLQANDFIEFYGEKANGNIDTKLYANPADQINIGQHLTSDTAFYFLTINNAGNHLRYIPQSNNINNPPTKEMYCMRSQRIDYRTVFQPGESSDNGQYYSPEFYNLNLSQYQKEGYIKKLTQDKDSISFTLANAYLDPTAPNIQIKTTVVGRTFYAHQMKLIVNGIQVADTTYSKFNFVPFHVSIPTSSVDTNKLLKIVYQPTGVGSDKYGVAFADIKYPALTELGNTKSLLFELNAKGTPFYLEFTGMNKGGYIPRLYDISGGNFIIADTTVSNLVRFILPASAVTKKYILQSQEPNATLQVLELKKIQFKNFTSAAQQGNYIIITDTTFANDGAGNNYVNSYKLYRSSAAGGNYKSIVAYLHDIYNEFGYGYSFSPLAIKNFLQYAHQNAAWTQKPKFIFIIGKGLEYNSYISYKSAAANAYPFVAVPTFGQPGSDLLFTDFDKNDKPLIPVGRLSAFNATDINNYLNKVKEYELTLKSNIHNIENKLWMKNVLHVGGTTDSLQSLAIINALTRQKQIIEKPFMGGSAQLIAKSKYMDVELKNSYKIDSAFNSGIGLLQFFGHSTASAIDYGLDFPEKYNNNKKYPLIIANGCGAGNIFLLTGQKYLSERYVLTPSKGAIGFIASVNTGFAGELGFYTDSLYSRIANTLYGKTIGEQMIHNIQSAMNIPFYANNMLYKMHTEQILLNGDPAIALFNSAKPDYIIEATGIAQTPQNVSTAIDSFSFVATFYNLGKYTSDSVVIRIKRTFPDGIQKTILNKKIAAFAYSFSQKITIPILNDIGAGENIFRFQIDPDNLVAELSESNNSVNVTVQVNNSGLQPVYPSKYSIINQMPVTLKANTLSAYAPMASYQIQIDTTQLFNSPLMKSTTINNVSGVVKWQPNITPIDSAVYYWRVVNSGDTNWRYSSFVYLQNTNPGWSQSHYYQYKENNFLQTNLQNLDRQFVFDKTKRHIQVQNVCMNGPAPYTYIWSDYMVKMDGATLYTFGCDPYPGFSSLQFVVIDSLTGKVWNNTRPDPNVAVGMYGSFDPCRITNNGIKEDPFFEFSFLNAASRKNMMDFLDIIPQGNYVMIQPRLCAGGGCGNVNNVFVNQWKADTAVYGSGQSLYHKLKNYGFNTIDSLYKNRPMIMWMQKGNAASIQQLVGNDVSVKLFGEFEYQISQNEGTITPELIGPAAAWTNFRRSLYTKDPQNTDVTRFLVYGVKPGVYEVPLARIQNDTTLAFINPTLYPYIKIIMDTKDPVFTTPSQLKYWRVHYTPIPEASLNTGSLFEVSNGVLPNTKNIKYSIENLTATSMDSLLIAYSIYDRFNSKMSTEYKKVKPLPGNDSIHVNYVLDLNNLYSNMKFEIDVNPNFHQPEQYHPNNVGIKSLAAIDPSLPLPITLLRFNVMEENCNTILEWDTKDEFNFSHFEVERKIQNNDFETLTTLASKSIDGATAYYRYIDTANTKGQKYYRLKMVDIDQHFIYSKVANISIICDHNEQSILYPNPATSLVTILLPAGDTDLVLVEIRNSLGQLINRKEIERIGNVQAIDFDVENLAAGVYHVVIKDSTISETLKFVKE